MRRQNLPNERLFKIENFGHSIARPGYLYRPTHTAQIVELFDLAHRNDLKIALRGAGRSYGDAAINGGGIVIDFRRMNRILEWDPETGIITIEPGVTIEQIWRYTMEDGWWLPVSPGTMFPTIGGCLGANVHGKNNWKAGTLGEHILNFTAVLPNGKEITCSPKENKQYFLAIISGMGLLGVFTSITMQMKKVYSGNLRVKAWAEPNLSRVLAALDEERENDYIVGWIDSTASGRGLGRGQMHSANYLKKGEDVHDAHTLNPTNQDLPDTIMGLVPKAIAYKFMRFGFNNLGMHFVNTAKYWAGRTLGHNKTTLQSLVAFTFLLDYVPNWELAYGKGGLIQYQSFVPKETAEDTFREILKLSHRRRLPSYLGVVKRHRPDNFLFSHAVDGYSLALDFKVTNRNRHRLIKMCQEFNRIVLSGNGRFYFAKDSTLTPAVIRSYLGENVVNTFLKLKKEADPEGILESGLFRRCFRS
jgi:decaprenylphospho-beta-D-ribofuranose 2-oxidase